MAFRALVFKGPNVTQTHFSNFSPNHSLHALYDLNHWTVCCSPNIFPACTSLSLDCDLSPMMIVVLFCLGCCNKKIIDWVP